MQVITARISESIERQTLNRESGSSLENKKKTRKGTKMTFTSKVL